MVAGQALRSKPPHDTTGRIAHIARSLAICVAGVCLPTVALAATEGDLCAHPLSGGWVCAKTFAVISLVYALIASSYGVGALLIGKPRLVPGRLRLGLVLVPLTAWLGAMLGFTLGGLLGLLHYAHDSSPFFFLDWFTLGVTFLTTTLTTILLYQRPRG